MIVLRPAVRFTVTERAAMVMAEKFLSAPPRRRDKLSARPQRRFATCSVCSRSGWPPLHPICTEPFEEVFTYYSEFPSHTATVSEHAPRAEVVP